MLLYNYGIFYYIYGADDVFHADGNAAEFDWKVIAVALTIAMCAQPLGNALYGVLFQVCEGFEYGVVFFSGAVSLFIAKHAIKM